MSCFVSEPGLDMILNPFALAWRPPLLTLVPLCVFLCVGLCSEKPKGCLKSLEMYKDIRGPNGLPFVFSCLSQIRWVGNDYVAAYLMADGCYVFR